MLSYYRLNVSDLSHYLPIYLPFNCMHLAIRAGIPATKFSRIEGLILAQATLRFADNCWRFVEDFISFSFCKILHRFSIGFKSGELPGHIPLAQEPDMLFLHHSCVRFAVCAGAPSCMKIARDMSGNNFLVKVSPVFLERLTAVQ